MLMNQKTKQINVENKAIERKREMGITLAWVVSIPEASRASCKTKLRSPATCCTLEPPRHTTREHEEEEGNGRGHKWNLENVEGSVRKEVLGREGDTVTEDIVS